MPVAGWASSHREAPFISKNPKVDGTDFYMFNSYETGRAGYVTILANYVPLQDAYGGPNYFGLDPDALYEIHIDNDGDAKEDLTFQFDFDSIFANGADGAALMIGPSGNQKSIALPFQVFAPLTTGANGEAGRNVMETYTVNVVRGNRRTGTATPITPPAGLTAFEKPFDNIGAKSIADYATYANQFKYNIDIPGCTPTGVTAGTHARMFVGQRKEGFSVNLGQIFDLVNFAATDDGVHANVVGARDQGFNTIANKNVTTIAIEIPASCLTKDAATPIIGGWTTASMRQARVLNPTATFTQPTREGGAWTQVSRLGTPLVNEVVIGLKDKDKFNGSEPKDDAQFADYVTNPSLPEVLELLFGGLGVRAPNNFPRTDLVVAFLQGVPNVNANGSTAEYLRLNTAIPATASASQSPYGAVGCFDAPTLAANAVLNTSNADCDPAGFPNGRRPGDDVVDIEIRAAMGALVNYTDAPAAGCLHATQVGCVPYVDGAGVTSADFDPSFPYLKSPVAGSPGGNNP
ncbi:MAG TPA: DUF4331 domain-containing protein [Kofleriaceae bacterium]